AMSIQTGPNRSPAKRYLAQHFECFFSALFSVSNLLRVTGEFLPEPDRCRVHQMGPADLDNIPKLFCLCLERAMQFLERGQQMSFQLLGRADVDRGRNHV